MCKSNKHTGNVKFVSLTCTVCAVRAETRSGRHKRFNPTYKRKSRGLPWYAVLAEIPPNLEFRSGSFWSICVWGSSSPPFVLVVKLFRGDVARIPDLI